MVTILNPVNHPSLTGMATVTVEHGNGNASRYVVYNGTHYRADTPLEVIDALEYSRDGRVRLYIEYGDAETGQAWGSGGIASCVVGRSMGPVRIPLEIKTARSHGGGAILDHCIVRITDHNGVCYQHPTYRPANEVIYFASLEDWSTIADHTPRQPATNTNANGDELSDRHRRVLPGRFREILDDAKRRGVKGCEIWLSGEERAVVDPIAARLGIALKVRKARF
jgi:hypothetical protein